MKTRFSVIALLAILTLGCNRPPEKEAVMPEDTTAAVNLVLDFVEALTERRYDDAYAMTASEFVQEGGERLGVDDLRERFELIVPRDWVFVDMEQIYAVSPPTPQQRAKHVRGPLAIMEAETDWVEAPDIAFMYVGIADEYEGEGVSVFVTREGGNLKVREISFGRP